MGLVVLLALFAAGPAAPDPPWFTAPLDAPMPVRLSATGVFEDLAALTPAKGLRYYEVNLPFWSDGAVKRRWIALPDAGPRISFSMDAPWAFPAGVVFVKHFELPAEEAGRPARRIETRVLVCGEDGAVKGGAYRWRRDGAEADLVREGRSAALCKDRRWYFPGPEDCRSCHTPAAGGVLGVNTRQLNRAGADGENQVLAWARAGMFNSAPAPEAVYASQALVPPGDDTAPLELRARSWLDVNCAYCHRPGGAVADFDARFGTPLAQQQLIEAPARINFGIDRARQIAPNDPWRSMVLHRVTTESATRMPPLAREHVDADGVRLLTAWIRSLPGPPTLAPPEVRPSGCDFTGSVRVEMRHPDAAAEIRYTLDGSVPTASSPFYTRPLVLEGSATVRARALRVEHTSSITVNETYIVLPTPAN